MNEQVLVARFENEITLLLFFRGQRLRRALEGDEKKIAQANTVLVTQKCRVVSLYRDALRREDGENE